MLSIRCCTCLVMFLLLTGCGGIQEKDKVFPEAEAKIKAALEKLSKDDLEAALAQRFCAVQTKNRLGSMGVPVKIVIKNKDKEEQTVWLCCKECEKEARKDEPKTAARADDLCIETLLATMPEKDRLLATAQRFCVVDTETRLGAMGVPNKLVVKDKKGTKVAVFLCCKGCIAEAKKDEDKTAKLVEEFRKKYAKPAGK